MPKKKNQVEDKADVISDLLELAQSLYLQDGLFNGDVEDESVDYARYLAGKINEAGLMSQLEFLYDHGYTSARLKELIEEYAAESTR